MRAVDVHCHPSTKEHSISIGKFIARDIADLKKECRQRIPQSLEAVISSAAVTLA